jgi:rRNA maturation RNase YbeY
MRINFTDAPRKNFPQKTLLKVCIKMTCEIFKMKPIELSYIFVSDQWLLEMNKEYLNHDYFTDIITFDNSEETGEIEGDIFISRDRVEENGKTIGTGIEDEYVRVIGHGLLHLCGLKDKTKAESMEMRKRENEFIALYNSLKFNPGN